MGSSGEKNHQKLGTFNSLPFPEGGGLLVKVKIVAFQFHTFNHVMFDCCLECLIFLLSVWKLPVLSDILNITAGRNIFLTEILVLNVKSY